MDKPTKPTNLIPRSFGGIKNNFSSSLQTTGYEVNVPAIYGGDNLNYQLDATGKELDYCETICDFINALPIGKTITVDNNNKLTYANNIDFSSRNIGEIVQTTIPLTDAGLHLLDGSLLQYGSYKDFIDYIADLFDSGNYNDIFETEANWQASVTTYGVCGKFVYDSVNNTVRLPKITGFTEGTITPSSLGDLTEAGLPNITGTTSCFQADYWRRSGGEASGAFSSNLRTGGTDGNDDQDTCGQDTFDASRSSSIYGNSSTVQPQSIKVLYYIVIATSTKTDIEVDIDEIATDLNGKLDTDGSNTTTILSNALLSRFMPDYDSGIFVGTPTSTAKFTAPATGIFVSSYQLRGSTGANVYVNNTIVYRVSNSSASYTAQPILVQLTKGDELYIAVTAGSDFTANTYSYFYPLKGGN